MNDAMNDDFSYIPSKKIINTFLLSSSSEHLHPLPNLENSHSHSPLMAASASANNNNNYFLLFRENNFNIVLHSPETTTPPAAPRIYPSNFPPAETDGHVKVSSLQATFAFIITLSMNLVQIKYQGRVKSPFQTHPETMSVVIVCLLLYYCLASCDAHLTTKRTANSASAPTHYNIGAYCHCFVRVSMGFCASLSLASILSVLVPDSLFPVMYTLPILFSLSQFPPSFARLKTIWDWLVKAPIDIILQLARRRRRGGGGAQNQQPWPLQLESNAFSSEAERLPLQLPPGVPYLP